MGLRITTWNVNGIRNPFSYQPWRDKRTFEAMFDTLEADIVIMQELKIQRKDLRDDMVLIPGWDCFFSMPKQKKGYSGVAIYVRQSVCAPIRAEEGLIGVLSSPNSNTPYRELPSDQSIGGYPSEAQLANVSADPDALDAEGRCVVLEFPAFVLFGIYSPANSNGLRDDFRYGFLSALDARVRNLSALGKNVIVTGDLNVSREEIDTANAEEIIRKEGLTHEEYISTPNRRIFNQLLKGGSVVEPRDEDREEPVLWDVCRGFHPDRKGMFTHWEQKINARPGNFGSRIDFILSSISMEDWFSDSNIQEGLMGSDHCPVFAVLKDIVQRGDESINILDIMNPPGVFEKGKRSRELATTDSLPFSGRQLPEFSNRRSIKDMFGSRAATITKPPQVQRQSLGNALRLSNNSPPAGEPTNTFESSTSPRTTKRKSVPSKTVTNKNNKRSKVPNPSSTSSLAKGQQSMKSFFQVKTREGGSPIKSTTSESEGNYVGQSAFSQSDKSQNMSQIAPDSATSSYTLVSEEVEKEVTSPTTALPTTPEDEYVIDPIVSKESWSKLFSKRAAPLCESHQEPCTSYVTKKPGVNCGRSFWLCSRPLGPSGNKEKGTQWRCHTFIWASDWNGGAPIQ